jgi:ribosome-binding protein aMBF1 (putative translation factor)
MQSTNTVQRDLLLRQETPRPRMAKAKFLDLSIREKRAAYGAILKRASELAGFNRDQTADELKVDAAQLGRWWSGDENAIRWSWRPSCG